MEKINQRIKDLKEIDIAIDTWDDIFSDFDPRPLNVRTLSEDFISVLRSRYRESRKGDFVITIYAPAVLKETKSENIVIQRLKNTSGIDFYKDKKRLYAYALEELSLF